MSTRHFAAGWTISKSLRIVAPSLEIVVPLLSVIILSIPRGPKVVLITSTIDWHALILLIIYDLPWESSVPSLRRRMLGYLFK